MGKFYSIVKCWWLVWLWMCVIFTASADSDSYRHSSIYFEPLVHWLFPQMAQAHVEMLHHLFRKTCHFTEYAVLALLCRRAIRRLTGKAHGPWRWDEAGLALAIVFAYAAGDELHQAFVPTRTALVSDVFIDATGGAGGLALRWLSQKILPTMKK